MIENGKIQGVTKQFSHDTTRMTQHDPKNGDSMKGGAMNVNFWLPHIAAIWCLATREDRHIGLLPVTTLVFCSFFLQELTLLFFWGGCYRPLVDVQNQQIFDTWVRLHSRNCTTLAAAMSLDFVLWCWRRPDLSLEVALMVDGGWPR